MSDMDEVYVTRIMAGMCQAFERLAGERSDEVLMFSIKDERAICSCDMNMKSIIEFMRAFIECNERSN